MITRQLLDGLGEPIDELALAIDANLPQSHHSTQSDTAQRHHSSQTLQQRRSDIIDGLKPITRRERGPTTGSKIVSDDPSGREHHARDDQYAHHNHGKGHQDSESLHTRSMTAPPSQNN